MSKNFELLQKLEKEFERNRGREFRVQPGLGLIDNASENHNASELKTSAIDDKSREEMTKLVQRLFVLPGASKMVVFSAVDRGDGCSWIAAHVAEELAAQVLGSVCVVDANFRAPSLHHYFAAENHRGLREAVSQPGPVKHFAQQLPVANLWLMPSGSPAANCESLIATSTFRLQIAELRREFDYVILDTPPLNLYTDAIAVAQSSDGIALVLRANSTRRDIAKKVAQDLEKADVRLLGAVLNQRSCAIPERVLRRLP